MMIKLNLTVRENTAKKIKLYAKNSKTSVSKIVEAYFDKLTEKKPRNHKSLVEKYGGILSGELRNFDKIKDDYFKEKYGI